MRYRKYDRENDKTEWKFGSNIIITVEGNLVPRELRL